MFTGFYVQGNAIKILSIESYLLGNDAFADLAYLKDEFQIQFFIFNVNTRFFYVILHAGHFFLNILL